MTCIAALVEPDTRTVLMGGDSRRLVNGGVFMQLPEDACKVYEFSGFVVGHTGAGRIRNLTSRLSIRFGAAGPSPSFNLEDELLSWMMKEFKRLAKDAGYLREKDGMPELEGQVLIAFGDQMCVIGGDFSVTPIPSGYWAIGSGQGLALGSLYTTEQIGGSMSAQQRLLLALSAAAAYDSSVARPFVFKQTTPIPVRTEG